MENVLQKLLTNAERRLRHTTTGYRHQQLAKAIYSGQQLLQQLRNPHRELLAVHARLCQILLLFNEAGLFN
jgi:hypothetical protein